MIFFEDKTMKLLTTVFWLIATITLATKVFMSLWLWFIVPLTHLAPFTNFWIAFATLMTVRFMTNYSMIDIARKSGVTGEESTTNLMRFLATAIMWGIGYLVHTYA